MHCTAIVGNRQKGKSNLARERRTLASPPPPLSATRNTFVSKHQLIYILTWNNFLRTCSTFASPAFSCVLRQRVVFQELHINGVSIEGDFRANRALMHDPPPPHLPHALTPSCPDSRSRREILEAIILFTLQHRCQNNRLFKS